jgi:hypothetical protein
MSGFFNTLLVIILVMILAGYLARLILPWLVRYFVKRMLKRTGLYTETPKPKKEGQIDIRVSPKNTGQKANLNKAGDYTDFEDVGQ